MIINKTTIFLVLYFILIVLGYSGFSKFLPVLLRENGLSIEVIGAAFTLEKSVVLGLLILTTTLSARFGTGSFKLMHILTLFLGILLLLFTMVRSALAYMILVPLFTGVYMGLRPFNKTLVNVFAPRKMLGSFVGLLHAVTRISVIISITLYGVLLEFVGVYRSMWILFSFVLGALLLQIVIVKRVAANTLYDREYNLGRNKNYSLRDLIASLKEIVYHPVIIYIATTSFFEAGVPVYLSIILWDLLGGPLPTSLAFIVIELGGLFFAPIIGVISDKINKPIILIILSKTIIAFAYIFLSTGYNINSYSWKITLITLALLALSLSPSIYSPNLHKFVRDVAESDAKRLTLFSSIDLLTAFLSIPAPVISGILIGIMGYSYYLLAMALSVISISILFVLVYFSKFE